MNYTVAKAVLREVDPLAVASARVVAGMLVFGVCLLVMDGAAGFAPARLKRGLPLGLLGIFANQVLFIEGLQRTTPSHSAILIALLPIHVLIIGALTGAERITRAKMLGVGIAFAGVVLVASEQGLTLHGGTLAGDLITLAAGVAFACYTVAGRSVVRDLGPLRTTSLAFLGGGAAVLLVGAPTALRQDWAGLSGPAWAGLLYVLFIATVGAYILYYMAIERLDPSKVAAYTYFQPLVGAALAYALRAEPPTARFVAGGVLILAGVVVAERG